MKLSGHEDLRVQRTIKSIRSALSVMLLNEDYTKITVTALCRHAVINKKTFYRYYDSIEDLLEELLNEFSQEYIEMIASYKAPHDLAKINAAFFHYAIQQGALYEKILCAASYEHISSRLISESIAKCWEPSPEFQNLSLAEQELFTTFIHTTGLAMYRQWVESGKTLPLERVIEISSTLLKNGVQGLLHRETSVRKV